MTIFMCRQRPLASSPWGKVQHATRLARGIYFVSTASHGGFWLSADRQIELRRKVTAEEYRPFTGNPEWWEEDCDWCIPAIVFAVDIDDTRMAEQAQAQLAGMAKSMGGQYKRAWEAMRV